MVWKVGRKHGALGRNDGSTLGTALGATLGAAGVDIARAPADTACVASTGLGRKHGALGRKDGSTLGTALGATLGAAGVDIARAPADAACLASTGLGRKHGALGRKYGSTLGTALGATLGAAGVDIARAPADAACLASTELGRKHGALGRKDGSTLGTALWATLGAAGLDIARAPADAACLASTGWQVGAERFGGAALGAVLRVAAPRAAPLGLNGAVIGLELAAAGWACEASMVWREGSTVGTALGAVLRVESVEGPARGADDWSATPLLRLRTGVTIGVVEEGAGSRVALLGRTVGVVPGAQLGATPMAILLGATPRLALL
jgi:hypothetical protein